MESAASPNIVLYSNCHSSCAWRVRFALNLKGLPYEYKGVDLTKKEQHTSEFDQVNPLHRVPSLVDDGVLVSESFAILMYLEEKYSENPLLPVDPLRRSISLQAASIVNSSIQPLHMGAVLFSLKQKLGGKETLSWAQLIIDKGFSALEILLKDFAGRFSMGDEVSLVDVFLAPQICSSISRFHIDMSKFPTLNRVYESCKNLPEYQASTPERQPDACEDQPVYKASTT